MCGVAFLAFNILFCTLIVFKKRGFIKKYTVYNLCRAFLNCNRIFLIQKSISNWILEEFYSFYRIFVESIFLFSLFLINLPEYIELKSQKIFYNRSTNSAAVNIYQPLPFYATQKIKDRTNVV